MTSRPIGREQLLPHLAITTQRPQNIPQRQTIAQQQPRPIQPPSPFSRPQVPQQTRRPVQPLKPFQQRPPTVQELARIRTGGNRHKYTTYL